MTNERSVELTDEILCALMDDELDAEMRARVEQALAEDAGAQVRLARMRAADVNLQAEFGLKPVASNDPLAAAILSGTPMPRVPTRRRSFAAFVGALAAGVAGIAIGMMLVRSDRDVAIAVNAPVSDGTLVAALNSRTSGGSAKTADREARVVLTFKAANGQYCRVFRWQQSGNEAEGLACREAEQWRVLAWDASVGRSGEFQTAGASELIDGVMDRLGGSTAFDASEERQAIHAKWR